MSAPTARALSMALVGGVTAILLFTQGLLVWAGFLAWGAFIAAGGDGAALKQTITGNLVGAALGWLALLLMIFIVMPADSWLWMPRTGAAIAVTLFILCMIPGGSSLPTKLYGYAAVLGASVRVVVDVTSGQRILGLHQYNPFLEVAISMVAGAVAGFLANKLAGSLSKA